MLGRGAKIDLVFSDILMPGEMNGLELGHAIRKLYPGMPVLLTTGFSTVACFANLGLPGLCGFVGEVMVLLGSFQAARPDRGNRAQRQKDHSRKRSHGILHDRLAYQMLIVHASPGWKTPADRYGSGGSR